VTFDPSGYEEGQLSGGVDLMAAAYEAQKQAVRDSFSGWELQELELTAAGVRGGLNLNV